MNRFKIMNHEISLKQPIKLTSFGCRNFVVNVRWGNLRLALRPHVRRHGVGRVRFQVGKTILRLRDPVGYVFPLIVVEDGGQIFKANGRRKPPEDQEAGRIERTLVDTDLCDLWTERKSVK